MKTFPVTAYDLKLKHLARFIGVLTGVALIWAAVAYFLLYDSIALIKNGIWAPVLVITCFGLLGVLLLVPLKVIRKRVVLRVFFSLLGGFVVFRTSFGAVYIYREIETLEKIIALLLFVMAAISVLYHIVTVNRKSEPGEMSNG